MEPPPRSHLDPASPDPLARQLRDAEADALGPWYAAEYPTVHRLCLGFLASAAEADGVATDAMLHLFDHIRAWDPARPYAPWRNRVVLNLCRDRIRRSDRRARHEQSAAELRSERPLPHPAEQASAVELRALLERALRSLAPREREAFVLVDLEGRSADEVATLTGLASSSVRASLSLARRRLRSLLADHLPEGYAIEGGAS